MLIKECMANKYISEDLSTKNFLITTEGFSGDIKNDFKAGNIFSNLSTAGYKEIHLILTMIE